MEEEDRRPLTRRHIVKPNIAEIGIVMLKEIRHWPSLSDVRRRI
jgi:hypothetical protein